MRYIKKKLMGCFPRASRFCWFCFPRRTSKAPNRTQNKYIFAFLLQPRFFLCLFCFALRESSYLRNKKCFFVPQTFPFMSWVRLLANTCTIRPRSLPPLAPSQAPRVLPSRVLGKDSSSTAPGVPLEVRKSFSS